MSNVPRLRTALAIVVIMLLTVVLVGAPVSADPDAGSPGDPEQPSPDVRVQQEVDVTPARIDGADRFDSAAISAEITFDAATTAIIARGDDFPDALAGAAAAGAEDAPVLLVTPDEVPDRTTAALVELAVDRVVVVGGQAAVSSAVEDELAAEHEVVRLAGPDRYATAAEVAQHVAATVGIGLMFGDRAALVASGEDFPDALASGPLAYSGHLPILLTASDQLQTSTRLALDDLDIERVLIVGGPAAVSTAVASEIEDLGITVDRTGGQNRSDTAAQLAGRLVDTWQYSAETPMLARGDDFPDALAASPRAGEVEAPVLLTRNPDVLSTPTAGWLGERCPAIDAVQAVGGTEAVAISTLADAVAAAESCADEAPSEPQRTITYETATAGTVFADLATFRLRARQALNDERGWSLGGDPAFTEVDSGASFRMWLASPQVVADAAPVCSPDWSCRVGDDVYINDERFREATATYASRSLTAYQWYVINHEVGHWLGLGHYSCPGAGEPAPVMQQQSIDLEGCTTNVWPLSWELDVVRDRWLP